MRRTPPATLQRRAEFLHIAARGRKTARPGFVLQLLNTAPDRDVRVGFTASRKVGNAVARNRARRRLREVVRLGLAEAELAGADLVVIARHDTAKLEFAALRVSFMETLVRMLRK